MGSSAVDLALGVIVAACWGATNPVLERNAKDSPGAAVAAPSNPALAFLRWLANWRFAVPFLVNQAGSVLNVYLISRANLLVTVPVTNGLSVVFNALSSAAVGGRAPSWRVASGALLIAAGTSLCTLAGGT